MKKLYGLDDLVDALDSMKRSVERSHSYLLDEIEDKGTLFELAGEIFAYWHEGDTASIIERIRSLYIERLGELPDIISNFTKPENAAMSSWFCEIFMQELTDRMSLEFTGNLYEMSCLMMAELIRDHMSIGESLWLTQ